MGSRRQKLFESKQGGLCFVISAVILLDMPSWTVFTPDSCIAVFFMNESLTFFQIVIKRNFIKKPVQETSLVATAILSLELLRKLLIKVIPLKSNVELSFLTAPLKCI